MMESLYENPPHEICRIMSRIYDRKLTTVSGGNLSLRDIRNNIWITPSGGDKSNYREDDILCIHPDGTIEGQKKPSIETEIHREIYMKRPDLMAIVHAHSPGLVALSLLHQVPETMLFPEIGQVAVRLAVSDYGCPGSQRLKEAVSTVFADGANMSILANHGAFVSSRFGLSHAFRIFEGLELCASIQVNAASLQSHLRLLTKKQLVQYNEALLASGAGTMAKPGQKEPAGAIAEELCDFSRRAYKRGLLVGMGTSLSARIDDGNFVVTAAHADLQSLEPKKLLSVTDCLPTGDGSLSGHEILHQVIYRENPDIGAVIMASPPNMMAFAVTDAVYNTRTIPECYIVLKKVRKFPFGTTLTAPEQLARYFHETAPTALVKNECFLCTGPNLLTAFDRLEVAEFCAQAWLNGKKLGGDFKNMADDQISELDQRFHLHK